MGDFPQRVTTETGGPYYDNNQPRSGGQTVIRATMNMSFIRSIPAILMVAETVLGLLHWTLVVSSPLLVGAAFGWVLFVAITLWILTIVLFFMILFDGHRYLICIPWTLTVMVYHIVASALYLTAFAVNAANVDVYYFIGYFGQMAAAAFFGALVWGLYCASAVFSFLDWKGDRANAATNTVPT